MDAIRVNEIVNKYGHNGRKAAVSGADALTGDTIPDQGAETGQVAGFRTALAARTDIKQGRLAAIAAVATATA